MVFIGRCFEVKIAIAQRPIAADASFNCPSQCFKKETVAKASLTSARLWPESPNLHQCGGAPRTANSRVNFVISSFSSIWCLDSVQTSISGISSISPFSSKTPFFFGRGVPQLLRRPPRRKHATQGMTSGVQC